MSMSFATMTAMAVSIAVAISMIYTTVMAITMRVALSLVLAVSGVAVAMAHTLSGRVACSLGFVFGRHG